MVLLLVIRPDQIAELNSWGQSVADGLRFARRVEQESPELSYKRRKAEFEKDFYESEVTRRSGKTEVQSDDAEVVEAPAKATG